MTDEQQLFERFGRQNPYRVPEGYFDEFADRMMAQLPQQARPVAIKRSLWPKLRPIAVAASITALITGSAFLFTHLPQQSANQNVMRATFTSASDDGMEQMADYVMADNHDFYTYLADY